MTAIAKHLIVRGGTPLRGTVHVNGSREASLALLSGALLATDRSVILHRIPDCGAVARQIKSLVSLGVTVQRQDDAVVLQPVASFRPNFDHSTPDHTHAAFLLVGPMLARTGRAVIPYPGPSEIGPYPIDRYLKGMTSLGATSRIEDGYLHIEAHRLYGADVFLDYPDVATTQTLMMAATGARGRTSIRHAAKDPEVVDLALFLSRMGAYVRGAGTDVITIEGGHRLYGVEHTVMGDRHEAALHMSAALATGGEVSVYGIEPVHLGAFLAKLEEIGATVSRDDGTVHLSVPKKTRSVFVRALPFPGFSADFYLLLVPSLAKASGTSIVNDSMTPERMLCLDEMRRLGVRAVIESGVAIVPGDKRLTGTSVRAAGPQAAAALLVGLLAAEGEGMLAHAHHLRFHYVDVVAQLQNLGAVFES